MTERKSTKTMYRGKALARIVAQKQENDAQLETIDPNHWYSIDPEVLANKELATRFVGMVYDTETKNFITQSTGTSNSICIQLYYSFASTLLSLAMTKTSVNGLLNRGGMFLFSHSQAELLLAEVMTAVYRKNSTIVDEVSGKRGTMLDLGSGDGSITQIVQDALNIENVFVTETSKPMQWRLRERNYTILEISEWPLLQDRIDIITAFNLIDRMSTPITLLKQLHQLATWNDCPVILAVVFPFSQFSEFSAANEISEKISLPYSTFEEGVDHFVREILEPNGFTVVKWTRLPYLCEGDSYQSYYYLHDAVFVLRPKV